MFIIFHKFFIIFLKLLSVNLVLSQNNEPSEIQRAQCTITAGEVQASAEATMTKTLKGVCGSEEMQLAFQELEIKLMKDIQEIKAILNELHSKLLSSSPKNESFKMSSNPTKTLKSEFKTIENNLNNNNNNKINITERNRNFTKVEKTSERSIGSNNNGFVKLKSNEVRNSYLKINRDSEINKLNNTVLSGEEIKLFSYYWKLENFSKKLEFKNSTEWSPVFSIAGKQLRIKAIFNHLQRDFLYLQLEQASSDIYGKFKSIMLETGTIFRNIEDDMKLFKHKISILNQINPSSDLVSQEFMNIGNGFLVPNSALLSSPYSKNDKIIIKLIINL